MKKKNISRQNIAKLASKTDDIIDEIPNSDVNLDEFLSVFGGNLEIKSNGDVIDKKTGKKKGKLN